MPDPKKKKTIVYAKGLKRTKGESNVKVPGQRIVSKSTLKMGSSK